MLTNIDIKCWIHQAFPSNLDVDCVICLLSYYKSAGYCQATSFLTVAFIQVNAIRLWTSVDVCIPTSLKEGGSDSGSSGLKIAGTSHLIPDLCTFPGSTLESLQEWYTPIISENIGLRSIIQSARKVTIYLGETVKSVWLVWRFSCATRRLPIQHHQTSRPESWSSWVPTMLSLFFLSDTIKNPWRIYIYIMACTWDYPLPSLDSSATRLLAHYTSLHLPLMNHGKKVLL